MPGLARPRGRRQEAPASPASSVLVVPGSGESAPTSTGTGLVPGTTKPPFNLVEVALVRDVTAAAQ